MDWLTTHLGETAALSAALCWVFTSLAFAAAGRRIGPTAVNLIRILLALVVLAIVHRIAFEAWAPPLTGRALVLLGASGLIGLTIGDQLYFSALVDVGPRVASLMMTLAPPVAALIAWPLLDEPLGAAKIGGILVTMGGIAWVVLERPDPRANRPAPHRVRGVIFGGLGGVCQAVGLVLSKLGMGHDPRVEMPAVGPWSATLVRMAFAAVGVVVLATAIRARRGPLPPRIDVSPESEHLPPGSPASRQLPFALAMVMIGVTFGPVLGVWSSMVAVDHAEAGVAATLMAMTPVFILPFAIFIERERVSWRAAIGAMVAVAGVGILASVSGGSPAS